VVHARGAAAHGYVQVYEPLSELTKGRIFLTTREKNASIRCVLHGKEPRGSAGYRQGCARFATSCYTDEGNFDLVGQQHAGVL